MHNYSRLLRHHLENITAFHCYGLDLTCGQETEILQAT